MKRVESARIKKLQNSNNIYYVGYVRFFNKGKYIYQTSTEITRLTRQDALQDAKSL